MGVAEAKMVPEDSATTRGMVAVLGDTLEAETLDTWAVSDPEEVLEETQVTEILVTPVDSDLGEDLEVTREEETLTTLEVKELVEMHLMTVTAPIRTI